MSTAHRVIDHLRMAHRHLLRGDLVTAFDQFSRARFNLGILGGMSLGGRDLNRYDRLLGIGCRIELRLEASIEDLMARRAA